MVRLPSPGPTELYRIMRRIAVSITGTLLVAGLLLLISITLGSRTPLSTIQLTSLIIGISALIFTIYPYIKTSYTGLLEVPESESVQPLARCFSILRNQRRRMVLLYMDDNIREITVGELAEAIAAEENEVTESEVTSSQRKRVYTALYQAHLPALEEAALIHYHQQKGFVELTDHGEEIIKILKLFTEHFEPRLSSDLGRSRDDIFSGIRNIRRRYVLHYLKESTRDTCDTTDLANQIAAWEQNCSSDAVTSDDRQRVYRSLCETHLEVLADIELIDRDETTGTVELTNDGDIISEWISLVEGKEDFPLSDNYTEATV